MLISTKGRYALRVMVDMAEHQSQGYLPPKEIAQRQGISEKYLESILKVLVQNHILVGLRGKGGGYRMVKGPEAHTVGTILRLTEGSLVPVACLDAGVQPCERADKCRTLPMWKELDGLVNNYLDSVTIADLMASVKPGDNYVI